VLYLSDKDCPLVEICEKHANTYKLCYASEHNDFGLPLVNRCSPAEKNMIIILATISEKLSKDSDK
jgi:hypothetical protein